MTVEHPFWDPGLGEWLELSTVTPETRVLAWLGAGRPRSLRIDETASTHHPCPVVVLDLSVAGEEHNFFAEGILVHNKSVVTDLSLALDQTAAVDMSLPDVGVSADVAISDGSAGDGDH